MFQQCFGLWSPVAGGRSVQGQGDLEGWGRLVPGGFLRRFRSPGIRCES